MVCNGRFSCGGGITPDAQGDFSFTIDGTTYYADTGMTWTQWVNSSYNDGSYTISGNYIKKGSKYIYSPTGLDGEKATAAIKANTAYASAS